MAGWGNFILDKGFNAAAAIGKYRAVKLVATTGSEAVTPVTASTEVIVGVSQFGVTAGEITAGKGASVRIAGVTLWELSGTVTRGQEVMTHTDGTCRTASGSGNRVAGIAMDGGVSGDYAVILLTPAGRVL